MAIDAIKPAIRLAQDTDTSRPGLAKAEDFCYMHIKPYSPYEQELLQAYEELRSSWDLTKEAATRLGSDIDPLVQGSRCLIIWYRIWGCRHTTHMASHT